MVQQCDECGSENIGNDDTGFFFCLDCGMVLEECIISPTANQCVGIHDREFYSPSILGTTVGNHGERKKQQRMVRLQKLQTGTFASIEAKASPVFKSLRARFSVNMQSDEFLKLFKKIYNKLPSGCKARNVRILTTVVFYRRCRQLGINLSLHEILDYAQVSRKHYFDVVHKLHAVEDEVLKISPKVSRNMAYSVLFELQSHYMLAPEILSVAKKIIKRYQRYLGVSSRVIAGSAYFLGAASLYAHNPLKVSRVAKTLNIAQSTIHNRVVAVKEYIQAKMEIREKRWQTIMNMCRQIEENRVRHLAQVKALLAPQLADFKGQAKKFHVFTHLLSPFPKSGPKQVKRGFITRILHLLALSGIKSTDHNYSQFIIHSSFPFTSPELRRFRRNLGLDRPPIDWENALSCLKGTLGSEDPPPQLSSAYMAGNKGPPTSGSFAPL